MENRMSHTYRGQQHNSLERPSRRDVGVDRQGSLALERHQGQRRLEAERQERLIELERQERLEHERQGRRLEAERQERLAAELERSSSRQGSRRELERQERLAELDRQERLIELERSSSRQGRSREHAAERQAERLTMVEFDDRSNDHRGMLELERSSSRQGRRDVERHEKRHDYLEERRARSHERCPVVSSASHHRLLTDGHRRKVLVGCTGSVATIKLPQLVERLSHHVDLRVVVTERAKHFLKETELPAGTQVLSDTVEWAAWQDRGDPVLHIDLAKWADLFLIAPLDANTLGKIASGVCDNILTCVARAWEPTKPLLFCPAMNTKMWEHPVTAPQVALLKSWGYKEVSCITKTLMCGDTGNGAMAEVDTIVQATIRALNPWDPYCPADLRL